MTLGFCIVTSFMTLPILYIGSEIAEWDVYTS